MTSRMGEQVSLFDLDIQFTRTSPEPCPQTKEKTSAASSKKRQGSSKKMPIYLNLQKGDGRIAESFFLRGVLSLGESTMPNFGESHSEEKESVYWQTLMDTPQPTYYSLLNCGEEPREPNPTILSQILEEETDPKYDLSAKACRGILNRASRRGKALPEILQRALEQQANES